MDSTELKYWELFIHRQAGNISEAEKQELNTWAKANPAEIADMENLFEKSAETSHPAFQPAQEWKDLEAIIAVEGARKHGTARMFHWIARIAATILVLFSVTYLFYFKSGDETPGGVLQTMVKTDASATHRVELPDQSVVWLNKESELLFAEQFEDDSRTVYLKGEAYFEVAPDKDRPFTIHAGNSKTTVIGTSFNLRAYSGEDEIRLSVLTGKVAFTLSDDREKVIVTPGNMASLNNKSMLISSGANTDVNFLSWKTNELLFNNQSMGDMIIALERHYRTSIDVENQAINSCRFTGNFNETTLDDALEIITRSLGSRYVKHDGKFTIQGEGCR